MGTILDLQYLSGIKIYQAGTSLSPPLSPSTTFNGTSGVLLYVGVKECMIGLKRNKGLIIERILVCRRIFSSHKFASLNTK